MTSSTDIQWTGFSFDTRDPVGDMDVVGIQMAYLDGHVAMPSDIANVLARRWAPNPADGAGPGLTATDLDSILAADPFSNSSYTIDITQGSNCTADGRFCRTTNQNLQYEPPPAGDQPITQTYSIQHQSTSTQGQGASDARQITFSTDLNASGSFFVKFSADLKSSDILTWTNKWSTLETQQVGQTATLSVTGPAASDNYTGPIQFDVFQDNVYGTFMFGFVPAPTFALTVTPSSQNITVGACTSYTASISALVSGFSNNVSLSLSGLPANATQSFNPSSITGAGSSTLTVCAASSTPVGNYTLTINATSGGETHSSAVALAVTDFTLSTTPSSQTVTQGSSASYTVSTSAIDGFGGSVALTVSGLPTGASGSFSPTSISGSGSSTLTVTTSSSTPVGSYSLTISGSNGNLGHTAVVTLAVNKPPTPKNPGPCSASFPAVGELTTQCP